MAGRITFKVAKKNRRTLKLKRRDAAEVSQVAPQRDPTPAPEPEPVSCIAEVEEPPGATVDDGEWEQCFALGGQFEAEEKYWEATAQYRRAENLKPDNVDGLNHLAFCTYMLGHYQEAQEIYLRALEKDPTNVQVLVRLAATFEAQEDYYNATIVYRRTVGVLTGSTFK